MEQRLKIIIWIVLIVCIVVGVLLYLYRYCIGCFPSRPSEQGCRAILTVQCAYCKNLNWTGRHDAEDKVQECAEKYWSDIAPKDFDDCSGIKQFCIDLNLIPVSS